MAARAVAAEADGSVVVLCDAEVLRLAASGAWTVVAGTGQPGFSGDGGPATAAHLNVGADLDAGGGIAVDADGSVVFTDTSNDRVRRIGTDGIIHTIAGKSPVAGPLGGLCDLLPHSGDGGPAAMARLRRPTDLLVSADGGYVIADTRGHRVRRIAPDGTITTIAGTGSDAMTPPSGNGRPATKVPIAFPRNLGALPDGTIAVNAGTTLGRITPDDRWHKLFGRSLSHARDFTGRGPGPVPPEYLAARPDGGLILATDALYEMTARHAATALTHITAATADDHRVAVGFNTNRAVRATLTVRRHGHTVARTTRNVRAGHHGLTVHGRFPARPHDVQVTVQAANGTASHDTVSLYLGGKLTIKEARAFITPTLEEGSITSCQRVTRRSVTCTIEAAGERSTATATLTPDGLIRVGAIHAAVAAPLDRARHGRRRVIHKRLAPWRQTPRGAARFWPSPSSRPGWWRRRADRRPFITLVVLQVALTVADGGTNREAAAALFLSPKTIEFHVSSKLGLSARPATGAMHADCAP